LALAKADHQLEKQLDPFLEVIDMRTKRREEYNYKSKDLLLNQSRIGFLREGALNSLTFRLNTKHTTVGTAEKYLYCGCFYKARLGDDGQCWTCVNESKFLAYLFARFAWPVLRGCSALGRKDGTASPPFCPVCTAGVSGFAMDQISEDETAPHD
jgi:hypothetical protein